MLKFGIRQAGGCGRRPKNAKPTTKPNVQTQKKAQGPRNPPEAPPRPPGGARRHPGGARRPPGGPREAPEASEAPQNPEGHRENEGTRGPRKPPEAPEAPGRFRSSEGHDRKSPQPFRKILKGYRSARDKTLDRSQADKGGVGI